MTGASGLVGTHTCRALAKRGWRVRALARDPVRAAMRLGSGPSEIRLGDLRDPAVVEAALGGAGAIVHLAAIAREHRGERLEQINVDATAALIEGARQAKVDRFIYLSLNGASPSSHSRFMRSKAAAEQLVRESGLRWTIFRSSLIFGPEDVFANVIARIIRLIPFVLPLPRTKRPPGDRRTGAARFQPVAATDVANAIADALGRADTAGAEYEIGGHVALTLEQMMSRVLVAMDARRRIISVPAGLMRVAAAVSQRLLPHAPVTTTHFEILSVDNVVPRNDLREVFEVLPAPFAAEELLYLRRITVWGALRSLFVRE